ncbi:hypothetical protein [Psychrobacter sp. M13]|uniref:hypothetical protein n=1 Tax=Psychrobacter sp. M13 TaxID=3067275 RepID=UPI00273C089F|nr:hypothetical protein [Psychrobacter sp. M13]WLP94207.1 hypothetical protein Q9G97_11560 [Psychrobacter sp. M13]
MVFGNKTEIAFDIQKKNGNFIVMDIIVNSVNISCRDNSYYILPLIKNIKKEIKFIGTNELFLKKSMHCTNLLELHDLFYDHRVKVYESNIEELDVLFYDLSTQNALFYVYQEEDMLVFLGKFIEGDELISTKVSKSDFLNTLSNLLTKIESM